MSLVSISNRPVEAGYYRAQIAFSTPLPLTDLRSKLESLGQAYSNQGQIGVFIAPDDKGVERFLDSTLPLSSWNWPDKTRWAPGMAIAHVMAGQAGQSVFVCDYMIVYMNVTKPDRLCVDGARPVLTVIDSSTGKVVSEQGDNGKRYLLPGQAGQTLGAGPLAALGYLAIDALVVFLMYAAGVFGAVAGVVWTFLGKVVKEIFPYLFGAGLLLAGAAAAKGSAPND